MGFLYLHMARIGNAFSYNVSLGGVGKGGGGAKFSSWLYGASLHRAFHHRLLLPRYDLDNVKKDVKHQIIIIIVPDSCFTERPNRSKNPALNPCPAE